MCLMIQAVADAVAGAVLAKYSELPKNGKPGPTEWTILAGFAATRPSSGSSYYMQRQPDDNFNARIMCTHACLALDHDMSLSKPPPKIEVCMHVAIPTTKMAYARGHRPLEQGSTEKADQPVIATSHRPDRRGRPRRGGSVGVSNW